MCGASIRTASTVPGEPAALAMAMPAEEAPKAEPEKAGAPIAAIPATNAPEAAGAAQVSAAARAAQRRTYVTEGTIVDKKYAIIRVLGEGGMGVVYLARDIHTGVDVVLKSVRSELAHRKDVRERTLAEGRALARIDHPNVVQLKAVVVEGDALWLVMQYIDGESLAQRIHRYIDEKKPMPIEEVTRIFRQIASGIEAAHREGVIHRDLKPANVLIRHKDGMTKVTDFGIAKGEEEARTGKGLTKGIIGSLFYMSPEQVAGRRDLDKRVDIYALGIVLYEMLMGRVPFDGETDYDIMRQHVEKPIGHVHTVRRDVPEALDAIVQKACAKQREQRYADCSALLRDLDGIGTAPAPAQTVSVPVTAESAPAQTQPDGAKTIEPTQPGQEGRRGLGLGIGIVLAAAAGFAVLAGTGVLPIFDRGPAPPKTSDAKPETTGAPSGTAPATTQTPSAAAPPSASPSAAPSASALSVPERKNPLLSLTGVWVGNGREMEAMMSGDELEFRVLNPAQFEAQGYEKGEARFALRALEGQNQVFAVEDRIRPVPPQGLSYDIEKARGTCLEVWTQAGKQPLRATYDGTRLTVEFAKIEPTRGNFTIQKDKVTSCIGLRKLAAAKVISTLTRKEGEEKTP